MTVLPPWPETVKREKHDIDEWDYQVNQGKSGEIEPGRPCVKPWTSCEVNTPVVKPIRRVILGHEHDCVLENLPRPHRPDKICNASADRGKERC